MSIRWGGDRGTGIELLEAAWTCTKLKKLGLDVPLAIGFGLRGRIVLRYLSRTLPLNRFAF